MKHIKHLLCVSLGIILFACSNPTTVDRLVGAWGYVNYTDTTYDEIYFTREFLVHNFESIGIRGVDEYQIFNDSVCLMPGKFFYFKVLDFEDDMLHIRNLDGIDLTLERLVIPDKSFRTFSIPDGRMIELQKGRILRGSELLLRKGLIEKSKVDGDSIVVVPAPEQAAGSRANQSQVMTDGYYRVVFSEDFKPPYEDYTLLIDKGRYEKRFGSGLKMPGKISRYSNLGYLLIDDTDERVEQKTEFQKAIEGLGRPIIEFESEYFSDSVKFRTTFQGNIHITINEGYLVRR